MKNHALLYRIAYLYYIDGKSQSEIAEELHIYRTSISRYLKQAREQGIVSIAIKDFNPELLQLERDLKEKLHLKQVQVVDVSAEVSLVQKQERFSREAGECLKQFFKREMTIGLVWGKTIAGMVEQLEQKTVQEATVLPLVGGPGHADTHYHVNTLVYEMSKKLSAQARFINATIIEENVQTKKAIVASKYFEEIQRGWQALDIAITSVGRGIYEQSKWHNLLSEEDLDELGLYEVAGDCCGRFFDKSGRVLKTQIDQRTIGFPLDKLKMVPYSIVLVSSKQKVGALLSAVKGGYFNTLVIDSDSARECLKRLGR